MCAWWNKIRKSASSPASEAVETKQLAGRKTQRARRVTIGLDFGTSSTKCMFREEGEGRPFRIVGYNNATSSWGHVLYPSSVALRGGVLRFGHLAEAGIGAGTVRSFKMCLPCLARGMQAGDPGNGTVCPRCLQERPGHFLLGSADLSAEDLSTLYLAVVLNHALERIRAVFGTSHPLRLLVNSAGPLDQLESFGALGECFHRVVFYAYALAGAATEEWKLDAALEALERVRRLPVPQRDQSPTVVVPESHAAITGYVKLPQSQKGLYGVVDVGAGTTDVAFFWLQKEPVEQAWYYSAGSLPVGIDDIDRRLSPVLKPGDGGLRAARERLSESELLRHEQLFKPVIQQMFRFHSDVLDDARKVHAHPHDWIFRGTAKYKLFLVGGGSCCTPVFERFMRPPIGDEWAEEPERLPVPKDLSVVLPGGREQTLAQLGETAVRPLLLLVYGLATPRPEIPKYDRDLEGLPAPEPDPDRLYWTPEEMYGHF